MRRLRAAICVFVEQKEQLGTGHALMVALPELKRAGMKKVLVVNGDTPLITTDTLRDFHVLC